MMMAATEPDDLLHHEFKCSRCGKSCWLTVMDYRGLPGGYPPIGWYIRGAYKEYTTVDHLLIGIPCSRATGCFVVFPQVEILRDYLLEHQDLVPLDLRPAIPWIKSETSFLVEPLPGTRTPYGSHEGWACLAIRLARREAERVGNATALRLIEGVLRSPPGLREMDVPTLKRLERNRKRRERNARNKREE